MLNFLSHFLEIRWTFNNSLIFSDGLKKRELERKPTRLMYIVSRSAGAFYSGKVVIQSRLNCAGI